MKLFDGGGNEITREDVLGWTPRGWRQVVSQLIDDLAVLGWDGVVLQVKQKLGGLRFYVTPASHHILGIDRRISEAEAQCENLCEVCGRPGGQVEIRWWISTLCAAHADAVRAGKAAWQVAEELDAAP